MLHVPGMPEGVHVSFSPEDQPVSAPAQSDRYTPPGLVGAGTPSEALTVLLDAHELAYGHALCSEAYGLPDLAERRQAEEDAFRALLHTPMHSDADRVAYASAVISRQMHSLGDGSATERDHPMAVAYRNLRFGEHAREPEEMRHVGRPAEPDTAADPTISAIAAYHAAHAAFDAIEAELEQHGMIPERCEREVALGEAEARAERAVWQTVPTTPAGRRALVDFARARVALSTHSSGRVDDPEHWLGLILDAFSAMVDADPTTSPLAPQDAKALAVLRAIEREWTAEIIAHDEERDDVSLEADARDQVRIDRKYALLDAAAALPIHSAAARHAKALALAWSYSVDVLRRDRTRDQYGLDGRLVVDLMDSLTGDASAPVPSLTVAPATPTAADPHVALLPALRQAFAWTRDVQPIINESKFASPEYGPANATQEHCWRLADRVLALPAPTTPAGLGVVALAMTVWTEGFIGSDPEIYNEERRHASAIRAMMSVAGVTPLPEWIGFGDEPNSKARWDAMMERAGEGSLPAWALAGKSGPDEEEIATSEEAALAVTPALAAPARPPVSDLARACVGLVERRAWVDQDGNAESLGGDDGIAAELDRHNAVFRRAIDEPSVTASDLAAKACLMLDDLDRFHEEDKNQTDDWRLMRAILREVMVLAGKSSPHEEDAASEGVPDTTHVVEAPAASLPILDLSGYSIPQLCALFDVYERAEDQFHIASWWPKLGRAGSELVIDEGDRCMALKGVVADELQKRTSADETNADDRAEKLMRRALVNGDWDATAHLACSLRNGVAPCQGKH